LQGIRIHPTIGNRGLSANHSVNEIILSHNNEKGYVIDILEELDKNGFTGESLLRLYHICDNDVERIAWYIERGKLEMFRNEKSAEEF